MKSSSEIPRATMRAVRILPILILLCAALRAEAPGEAIKRRRMEYPDLSQIVDLAQSAPPEFAARALLRVAQSADLRDKAWKCELLDQAFQTAAFARNPVRRRIGLESKSDGSREQMISEAGKLGLDRLTLQTKAAIAMLALNPRRARELFLAIPQPLPARSSCEGALVDDPSSYFAAAATIAATAFTPEERRRDDLALFLNERVQRIGSAVELAPAMRMISDSSSRVNAAQYKLLVSSLAAALQRIEGDDRAFSSSIAAVSKEMARFTGSELAESYQQFLARNLTGPRCADSDYGQLKLEDLKPSKTESKAILTYPIEKSEADRLIAKLMSLLFGGGHAALTDAQKSTPEWREQFSDVLHEFEGIKPASGESDAQFYYRKGAPLHGLLTVAPKGETRDKILQEYIAFLKGSNFQQESLIEWFSLVEALAEDTRSMSRQEYKKLLDAFEASGHTVLLLYARIEKLLPSAPSWAQIAQ